MSVPAVERPYRGLDPAQRREDRRARLLAAALELFGTAGYPATGIQAVCARAGVTARHFYEAFPGREELLRALYDGVIADHRAALAAALGEAPGDAEPRLRAGLEAALGWWAADERRARVAFKEVVGVSEAFETHRLATIDGYAALLAAEFAVLAPGRDHVWTARAFVGAITQVVELWLPLADRPPLARLVDDLVRLGLGALDNRDCQ